MREQRRWGPIDPLGPEDWLRALLDHRTRLTHCRAFANPVAGDWSTQPRVDPVYQTHYLFLAPQATLAVQLQGGLEEAAPQTLLWFPPGVPYELRMHSRRRSESLLRLRFQLWRGSRLLTPFDDRTACPQAGFAAETVNRLLGEFAADSPEMPYRVRCLLGLLSSDVQRSLRTAAERPEGLGQEQMRRLIAYHARSLHRWPTPAELAAEAGLAPSYFARVFRRSFDCSPRRWLVEERIRHGATLLTESDAPIAQIALELGYDNPFLFTRQFTAVMGMSPTAYRSSRAR